MALKLPGRKPKAQPLSEEARPAFDQATVILPPPEQGKKDKLAKPVNGGRGAKGTDAAALDPVAGPDAGARRAARGLPLIGRLPVARQYAVLGVALLVLAVLAAVTVVVDGRQASDGATYLATAGNMRMLTQRIAKDAQGIQSGNAALLSQLAGARGEFADGLNLLMLGAQGTGRALPAGSAAVQPVLDELSRDWQRTERNIAVLVGQQKNLTAAAAAAAAQQSARPALRDAAREVQALKLHARPDAPAAALPVQLPGQLAEQVSAMLEREAALGPVPAGPGPGAAAAASNVAPNMAANATAATANAVLANPANPAATGAPAASVGAAALDALNQDAATVRASLAQLRSVADAEAAPRLDVFETAFNAFQQAAVAEAGGVAALQAARGAARQITDDSELLFAETERAVAAYQIELTGRMGNFIFLGVLALLGTTVIWMMVRVYVTDERRRAEQAERQRAETERQNSANQDAILRLMNEMGALADGDLRARATVTEDITGAIADAVNYTVEELSKLVARINDACTQLLGATGSAQHTSEQLLAAADYQSREIRDSSASVLGMAGAMTRISDSAAQSAEVASQSLAAAGKGRQAVENAITGMDGLRIQIQETSKRIKRLGESSQEIGEIVELISGITEQTNVLALNAAIQAAGAGEAGRGFSVVAEEVQRLAERSADAARRIGAIVKSIQSDTQETIAAMENSTQGVVEGARLSDAAGQALGEIGEVSGKLAALVADITAITEEQSRAAQAVAGNMQGILAITEQATAGTQRTAQSIDQLSKLARGLKASVANFKI